MTAALRKSAIYNVIIGSILIGTLGGALSSALIEFMRWI